MNEPRAAEEEDFAAIRALLAENTLVHEDLTPASLDNFVVVPLEENLSRVAAVAGLELFYGDKEGLLRSLAVCPSLRGRGLGVSLVASIEARARELDIQRLWLLTTTAPDFFRRLGYADADRAQAPRSVRQSGEFQHLCPASAVCLVKSL
jgi:amino-acid N-acetyltransferase